MNISPGQAMQNPFLAAGSKVGERKSGGIVGRLMDIKVHEANRAVDVQAGMALQQHAHGLTLERMNAEHGYKLAQIKAEGKQGRKNTLTQAGADVARMKEQGHQERLSHGYILRTNAKYENPVAPHDAGTIPTPQAHVGPEPVRVPAPPRLSVPVMAAAAKVQPPQAQKVPTGNKPKMSAASLNPSKPDRTTPAPSAAAKQDTPKAPTASGQLGIPGVARPQARMTAPAKPPKR